MKFVGSTQRIVPTRSNPAVNSPIPRILAPTSCMQLVPRPRATVHLDDIGHMLEPRAHAQFGRCEYCVKYILQIQNLHTHVHNQFSPSDKQLHLTWLLPFSNHTSKRSTGCPSAFIRGGAISSRVTPYVLQSNFHGT